MYSSIPLVKDFSSDGETINVYADLQHHEVNELRRQLRDITGQSDDRFKLLDFKGKEMND